MWEQVRPSVVLQTENLAENSRTTANLEEVTTSSSKELMLQGCCLGLCFQPHIIGCVSVLGW